jgi:hypothetical protein
MATYENTSGDLIVTMGGIYRFFRNYPQDGLIESKKVDVSKWTRDAERWIDSDIKDGNYQGYTKKSGRGL